jgi:hypothetical protein
MIPYPSNGRAAIGDMRRDTPVPPGKKVNDGTLDGAAEITRRK